MRIKRDLFCDRCCRNIRPSRVIIMNKKLVCPYCYKTIETSLSKVKFIRNLKDALENKRKDE